MDLQPEFVDLVAKLSDLCARRFGVRLAGSYLSGSVPLGEAWPGASDVDWFTFLSDEPTSADRSWSRRWQRNLQQRYPAAAEVHLNLFPLQKLREEASWGFILRYNSERVLGEDVIARLADEGLEIVTAGPEVARSRLPFARRCLDEALAGRCPPALATIPANPYLASRKYARLFVIVEGAYLLMSRGEFRSFRQPDVVSGLRRVASDWERLLETTEQILADPYRAGVRPDELLAELGPFVAWMLQDIAAS